MQEDGSLLKLNHLERPQLYMEKGVPVALLCAADTIDSNGVIHAWNIQMPIIENK